MAAEDTPEAQEGRSYSQKTAGVGEGAREERQGNISLNLLTFVDRPGFGIEFLTALELKEFGKSRNDAECPTRNRPFE
jgi:hypothetical protein